MQSILIRSTNWVGDSILTTPAVRALRYLYPQAKLTLLIKQNLRELWKDNPDITEILIHPDKLTLGSFFSLINQLRQKKFDLAVLFPNSFSAAVSVFLAGIPHRIGYATEHRSWLLTDPVPVTDIILHTHQVNYYLNLVRQLGEVKNPPELVLNLRKEEQDYAEKVFAEFKIPAGNLIVGINPGATYGSAKRWLPERYCELANRLITEYSASIVLFGSAQEVEYINQFAQKIGSPSSVFNLAGKNNLAQLTASIAQCHLFITNDTGPMHIAAALKIPTVAIFGSTDPVTTSPFGNFPNRIVRKPANCAPCLLRECPTDHRCMTAITVDDVLSAVNDLIATLG
ncbi:MAG: lipopolysaccharide heptosyltransferase II [bacterium]|nr:lipopolysaccharide heptosyltransferase II [bacterium]